LGIYKAVIDMRMFITTYDKSSYILKHFEWLADRYIPEWKDIVVLGYKVFPALSERFKTVSIGEVQTTWARDYYNYFKSIDDEFVFMCMDDMLPASEIDWEVLNTTMGIMLLDETIGRYELGTGHSWHGMVNEIYADIDWSVYEYGADSQYMISCMPAIWRREYLLKYLNHDWNMWQFELDGSKIALSDGYKTIATKGRYAYKTNHTVSSSRYPGLMNVAGLDKNTVEEMISLGFFERDKLILGENLQEAKKYE
jgi:hypothetical protein